MIFFIICGFALGNDDTKRDEGRAMHRAELSSRGRTFVANFDAIIRQLLLGDWADVDAAKMYEWSLSVWRFKAHTLAHHIRI
jgi:hypothetical protein